MGDRRSCRAILDTNVVVQAALNGRGESGRLLALASTDYEMVTSAKHLLEVRQVLGRSWVVKRGLTTGRRDEFLTALEIASTVLDDPEIRVPLTSDYRDNFVVALAQANEAFLITRDRGILDNHPYGLPVFTPASFSNVLANWHPQQPRRFSWRDAETNKTVIGIGTEPNNAIAAASLPDGGGLGRAGLTLGL